MVRLDDAVPARLKTHGTTFEVLVDPDGALALKRGDSVNLEDILAVEDVFENASRGDRSPEEDLQKAFGTTDPLSIAPVIIKKGEISLTADQRKRFLENKRRQVIEVIARNAINPQTKTPHPPGRIDQATHDEEDHRCATLRGACSADRSGPTVILSIQSPQKKLGTPKRSGIP